jgi:hypothetical protein
MIQWGGAGFLGRFVKPLLHDGVIPIVFLGMEGFTTSFGPSALSLTPHGRRLPTT